MSQTKILVIDDSATIRRLVDSHLSQEGYQVILAAGAEEGLAKANENQPDVILLDHQLPGTTGRQVCQQLIDSPTLCRIPVVVTSTLRKQAYAEYTDAANVVDSLPKPFTPELLKTTVSNALETGSLVVASQSEGSAVPEVIEALGDAALAGTFAAFGLRELVDFLNNGANRGALEIETQKERVWFYLEGGRIQAVIGSAVDPEEIAGTLPERLRDLAPVLSFTLSGQSSPQVTGLVDLLDKKVLDARMLRGLLRHQAAYLTRRCFEGMLKGFRFEADLLPAPLFQRIPLDISLPALLVEGASVMPESALPAEADNLVYVRRGIKGQNLDRSGLSAQHMRVLGCLDRPLGSAEIAGRLDMPRDEVRRVLYGLGLAEWVQSQIQADARFVIALETDPMAAEHLRQLFAAEGDGPYTGKVVRDRLAVQLLLKRSRPDALLLALDGEAERKLAGDLAGSKEQHGAKLIGVAPQEEETADEELAAQLHLDAVIRRPYEIDALVGTLDRLIAELSDAPGADASGALDTPGDAEAAKDSEHDEEQQDAAHDESTDVSLATSKDY